MIVGIGASAGGLDAFKAFLGAAPANTGMAFVLVQHLSPSHKSMLAELLGKVTAMRVEEAVDGAPVEADRVYIIPPDSTLTMSHSRLRVAHPAPPREQRRPIDTFFQSLAEDQGENAIGVILAGTGSDGSLGLAAIKEGGGLTLAQAESDHRAMPGMPLSAARTGQVDDVLPAEAMPARLIEYRSHLSNVAARKGADGARKDAGANLAAIMAALRARTGHDFSEYKEKTLVRRLQRRMQVLRIDTPGAYIEHFRRRPEELDLLFRELLIGVTEFFREPDAFEALAAQVLRGLVAGKGADDEIRVWVPGCATGQEAFSIAILLREAMGARRPRPKVQIFATDIDEQAIAAARAGRYRKPVAGLSPERLERWFTEEGDDACVIPDIREMCVLSTHSVIKHPPFSKLDLVSCRNLLIYLDTEMQDRVLRTFHYALKPGGHLFLGSSESASRAGRLFAAQDKRHRIFARREVDRPTLPQLSRSRTRLDPLAMARAAPNPPIDRIETQTRQVTEKHNPPHVVIDAQDRIVHFSGPAMGAYVELSAGAPSYALFDILRRPLRPIVRAALKAARASKEAVRHESIPIRIEGQSRFVTLIVEPLVGRDVEAGFNVLVFREADVAGSPAALEPEATEAVKAVEQELRTTRAQLQSTIDELESANEELKSSNEEQQSINEELQSSNEELETAKEEMQSVNEEVQTINAELASKNEQLTRLNSDLRNLFESAQIATLFLDADLHVKGFTPGLRELFHVRDADIGRPVTEIVSLLAYPDLQRDARTVLRKLTMIERQVALEDGAMTFLLRLRPYRTIDNVIDGVVLAFVDITDRQHHEQQQELVLRELDHRVKNLFAVVGGMVTLSGRSAATPKDMEQVILGRLGALASAHTLVLPQHGEGARSRYASLEELVRIILAPYVDAEGPAGRIEIDGPEVPVSGDAATSIAMVIHELATNAAKYGALSPAGGRVRISWSTSDGRLNLSWNESGGPRVTGPPSHEGFGSRLARRSVEGQLSGDMVAHWKPDGLAVLLSASLERLAV